MKQFIIAIFVFLLLTHCISKNGGAQGAQLENPPGMEKMAETPWQHLARDGEDG